ncbi:MAG: dihydrolipoyl dehydrogenase family protein [Candidatus Dormibacteria bacterium]
MAETPRYDLAVIGAGSAGLVAARFAADVGARVALLERDRIGGDCTWTGCVPSKTLLQAASVAHNMREAARFGLTAHLPGVDLAQVMARVKAAVDSVYSHESPEELRQQGIDVYFGDVSFIDRQTLRCADRTISTRKTIIATGARPVVPDIPGLSLIPFVTYAGIFEVEHLPRRLAVLGGGPIGVELAQAFQRLGSEVTIFESQDRLLPMADPEAAAVLARCLQNEGVSVRIGTPVASAAPRAGGAILLAGGGEHEADLVLVATGRRPDHSGLQLERMEVDMSGPRVKVNSRLQTSVPSIYAAGDAASIVQFTHYAGFQGYAAARNALFPGRVLGEREGVPWLVFTEPEVGQIGMTEAEARKSGARVEVHRLAMENVDRAQTIGRTQGFVKVVSRPTGRIIGGVAVAANAGAIINELALAISQRVTLGELATTIHAYPTFGSGLQQLASDAAMQRSKRGWRAGLLKSIARRGG